MLNNTGDKAEPWGRPGVIDLRSRSQGSDAHSLHRRPRARTCARLASPWHHIRQITIWQGPHHKGCHESQEGLECSKTDGYLQDATEDLVYPISIACAFCDRLWFWDTDSVCLPVEAS